eukprot:scaffold64687_cov74-Phaeocystis_antarctica.AAC.4
MGPGGLATPGAGGCLRAPPQQYDPLLAVRADGGTRDRAISAEIIATWPYAPAGGMARKTTHERYLGHGRSSQSEELTTRTCIAPARGAHPPKMTDAT